MSAALVDPALGARVDEVMRRTGGVAREVNRFLIECAGDGTQYDRVATQVYYAKFRKLLTAEGSAEFDVELRSSFSIIMAGLHLHYPVPFASIPALWKDFGNCRAGSRWTDSSVRLSCAEACSGRALLRTNSCSSEEAVHFLVRSTHNT